MANFIQIKQLLEKEGLKFKAINLPSAAFTVEDVVRLSGGEVNPQEIVKTLIVKTKSGQFVACVLKGKDRLDKKKLAFYRLATSKEVLQIAQVEVGAVCPILIGIPIIIDEKVRSQKRVNMGSGDLHKGLELHLADLLTLLPNHRFQHLAESSTDAMLTDRLW